MAASDKSRVGVRDAFGSVLSTATLILVAILAFSIRLFSVIKYESVIHEFDPYFNYRVTKEADAGRGFDRVRRTEIGKKHFKLTHFEEVFTTHHWMVRIYKLKPSINRLRGKNKKRTKSSTKRGKYSSSRKQEKKNPWH